MSDKRYVKNTGTKYDSFKPMHHLIPEEVLTLLAMLFTCGCEKYDERDIENGLEYSRLYAAARRHMSNFWNSKDLPLEDRLDPETGLPHEVAAIWNLVILSFFNLHPDHYSSFDDRPNGHRSELVGKILEIASQRAGELRRQKQARLARTAAGGAGSSLAQKFLSGGAG